MIVEEGVIIDVNVEEPGASGAQPSLVSWVKEKLPFDR